MKIWSNISIICLFGVFSGCSNTRFLTDDQVLYTGRKKVEIINLQQEAKNSSVKNYVKSITNHKVNNALFSHRILPPIGLWVHNYMKTDKETIKKEQEAVRPNKLFSDSLDHDLEIRELSRARYDELINDGWKHQDIMDAHPVIPYSVRREGREWLDGKG